VARPRGRRAVTRRQAAGLLLAALLLAGGRLVRHALMVDGAGRWRDPLLLESLLPAEPAPAPPGSGASGHAGAPGDSATAPAGAAAAAFAGRLDPNTSPADSLELLPGIGPALAARIVAERAAGGPFQGAADLERVRGIGPRLAARLAPHLRFATPDARAGFGAAPAAPSAPR